jgi:hypothetical protein
MTTRTTLNGRVLHGIGAFVLTVACATSIAQRTDVNKSSETAARVQIAATNLEDTESCRNSAAR